MSIPVTVPISPGPIFSCDRWIPDVLCRAISLERGPHPELLGGTGYPATYDPAGAWVSIHTPTPEAPRPDYEYYVDYCTFFGSAPIPFEHFSDEFNIPDYLAQWQIQPQCTVADTFSHPGQLAFTLQPVHARCTQITRRNIGVGLT